MAKFPWQKQEREDGTSEVTLPDELVTQIKAGAEAASQVSKLTEIVTGLKTIMEGSANKQKEEEEARKRAEIAARNKNTQEEVDQQIEELMLTNPKEAIRLATQGDKVAILTLNANNIRREVFEDQDKFKYYHGDLKSEVDKLINGQTLAARQDPGVVENCYLTVLGRHTEEIREGKIKTRFASSESSSRGTNGGSGDSQVGDKQLPVVTDDVRKAAKLFGIKAEDYAEMLEKDGVGYV